VRTPWRAIVGQDVAGSTPFRKFFANSQKYALIYARGYWSQLFSRSGTPWPYFGPSVFLDYEMAAPELSPAAEVERRQAIESL